MRIRLFTGLVVAGLAVVGVLASFRGLGAREVVVPSPPMQVGSEEASTTPVTRIEGVPCSMRIPTMLVNTRKIRLNYSVSDVGPSGVAAIELWATRDGRHWQRYSNEPPPDGPLVVHVAEEGRYGFSIVVKSGVGLSSSHPRTGDDPQLWVEVDETRPVVHLSEVYLGKGAEAGTLSIHWAASDAHLMLRPVTICTSPTRDGPWTPIVTNLDNTGKYVWRMPKELPYQFFVRVEAQDRAGNVGYACAAEPVRVDLARPKGTILGVDMEKQPHARIRVTEEQCYPGCEYAKEEK